MERPSRWSEIAPVVVAFAGGIRLPFLLYMD
jgi:hypothetical protein